MTIPILSAIALYTIAVFIGLIPKKPKVSTYTYKSHTCYIYKLGRRNYTITLKPDDFTGCRSSTTLANAQALFREACDKNRGELW